ncbi:histidine phosphatase family protein [Pseudonocardia pini]|uniref:histidine phosphatase family protein n=1 Tax=Pseudonocardia pini TaxID=2758030 RepID=UPI0015F0B2F7|nr:histidine phosphatase family protein [Pseudonocardia pini]
MRLVLIRHGLPERVTGETGTADPHLTELGLRQAERVVHALAGDPVDAVYASTMARAIETAGPLADARGLPVHTDHELREFDADQKRYLPVHELARENPDQWNRMVEGHLPEHVDVPGFTTRAVAALERIVEAHPGRGTAVVFAHAGIINVYLGHLLGIARPLPFPLDYTGVTRVVARRDGVRKPRTVNEIGHVADLLEPAAST